MTNALGFLKASPYENVQLALILMRHYHLSGLLNKCSWVRSGIDHLDRAHFEKPLFQELCELIGGIANQVVGQITHCHIQSINFVNQLI